MRITTLVLCTVFLAMPSFAATRISAWIPPWDANALTSIESNVGVLTEANPVWYSWNADDTIAKNWNAENPTWRAAMTGSLLIPTIQNVVNQAFSDTAVATMLSTPANREAHATAIFQLVTSNAFDGIDVDYERVPTTSRANFTAFVTTLAAKLHGAGKKLSVTVYAKSSDEMWNGAGAEDWIAIGGLADSVKIMAYDYHWATSSPGAITPLSWLDAVATYAESTIPAAKIVMGLPWYGYDWPGGGTAANATYASAMQTAQNNGATVARDPSSGEPTYTYANHVVFFNDAASYQAKIDLLKQKHGGITAFAHWSAGVEDPAIWNALRATPSTSLPPADFTLAGPASFTVTQGSTTTGSYTLVPINNFTGVASVVVLPSSPLVTLSNPTVAASSAVTLQITTTRSTAPGTYPMTLRFTSGALAHDVPFTIVVKALPGRHRAAAK